MKYIAILSLVLLSACVSASHISNEQLSAMPDEQLCSTVKSYPTDRRVISFMSGRELTCHPAMETCEMAGYKMGTTDYDDCVTYNLVQIIEEEEKHKRGLRAMGAAMAASSYSPPVQRSPTTFTNCNYTGGGYSCMSY